MKKIILITGSCGLVGSEAALFFLKKKFNVIGIDNNKRKFFFGNDGSNFLIKKKLIKHKNYKHYNLDLVNNKSIENIIKKNKSRISLFIHSAAQPSHDWAKKNIELDYEINASATLKLLLMFKNYCPKSKFIFMSTNKVYGDTPNNIKFFEKKTRYSIPENHLFSKGVDETMNIDNSTHSFFGVSKASADLMTQEFGKNFRLNTIIFRAGCITGPNHNGAELHGFLSYLVKSLIKKNEYKVIGHKGKQVRDNIHSFDLVNCFWNYYKSKKKFYGEVFNIGGGNKSNCSVLEAINYVKKKVLIKPKITFEKKNRLGDHIWWITNNSKFKKNFKTWKQKYSIKKILDELINYEINNTKLKN